MARHIGPYKYEPLTRYLAALTVDEVTLPLGEIEQIIAAPLPVSARLPTFWANGRRGLYGVRPWVRAGWRVVRTDLHARPPVVHFARVAHGMP
jgi:hypothetical protein